MKQSRRMLVLRAVVEDYIRSHEPVGSTSLTRGHDLGVSSATIRNDMAVLEDEGYLIQPHTSAGRIPTEKGYRYFVDKLATVVPLSPAQRRGIRNFLEGSASLEDTLQRAARLLASITGQVAVVASPSLTKSTVRHIELIPVSMTTLLTIVITDTGRVVQQLVNVPMIPDADELRRLGNAVAARCDGLTLRHAADAIRTMRECRMSVRVDALLRTVADGLSSMADEEHASDLYVSGASHLAQHAEQGRDLAPLFDALEEQVVLMRLMTTLSETENPRGIGVAIGSETQTPGLMHASVVTSGYGSAGTDGEGDGDAADESSPVAFVGSIGPTHMDYAATMAAVRAVARYLTDFLSPGASADDDDRQSCTDDAGTDGDDPQPRN
ncbi:heat-inducible transcriptional repressor HrcA [Bifidobacterium choloepi]|uniref:Heat-inducible transcription repressor HrcA n=1 Tax=Bifidobacterium choloepi TaxID=2614131 RepID=A0A6I5MZ50_9BIFI|nr:heat-inducible transcriptional repressor HrcA [Bifidobacterium choloepi]